MKDVHFKALTLLSLVAITVLLFLQSQNGRYQYAHDDKMDKGVVIDTRTGAYWLEDGTYIEPRQARITVHEPAVTDKTTNATAPSSSPASHQ